MQFLSWHSIFIFLQKRKKRLGQDTYSTSILVLLLLVLLSMGCERDLELNIPDEGNKLVVFAPFSNQRPIELQLWRGDNFSIDSFILLTGAEVNLFENGTFRERLENVNSSTLSIPVYQSATIPKMGNAYSVEVSFPGFPSISSSSSIPAFSPNTIVGVEDVQLTDQSRSGALYTVKAYFIFSDSMDIENFYHLKVFQDIERISLISEGDTSISTRRIEIGPSVIENDNNMVLSFDGGMLFDDENFDGKSYFLQFWYTTNLNRDERLGKLHVQLKNTSEEYYLYYTSLSRQLTSPGPPNSEPVIVYNNIEQGLGIFAGYTVSMDSVSLR